LWKGFKRLRARAGKHTTFINVFALLLALIWLGASFWYGGGRKIYYDRQVDKLCAVDGGIKVYETVRLPADDFNQWGQPNFYKPNRGEDALGSEYIYKFERKNYREGVPTIRSGEVAVERILMQITRRSDKKLLGEAKIYNRAGGDIPGPWMPSGYTCPTSAEVNELALMENVFISE
jgi:hypothetical protein